MVSSGKSADHNVSSDKLQQKLSSISGITISQGTHANTIHSSKREGARSDPSVITKKELQDSDATVYALQSDQEGSTCSLPHKKPLQIPKTIPRALQSGQSSPSIIREKVSKDGYNWRKYGQKNVKGNEYIRSYYKCTHPNCQAKKQLEQSNNGEITDTICIGHHNHPSPQLNNSVPVDSVMPVVEERADKASLANVEDEEGATLGHGCTTQQIKPEVCLSISTVPTSDEVKGAHLQLTKVKDEVHNYEDPESKRLKKENCNEDVSRVVKSTSESRVVVQTSSEVDFVNDGYRWRKYGQKLVKGNPNPRSYYRCSNPGCPVKKHVERASHDPKIVMTTYEGQHDHDLPPGRTVTHNAGGNNHTAANNGKSETKSGINPVSVDAGKLTCSASESILKERLNEETSAKLETGEKIGSHVITRSSESPESEPSKQEHQNGNSDTKDDSVHIDVKGHLSSEVLCQSNDKMEGGVKSEENKDDCLHIVAVKDTPDPDDKSNIRSNSDEKPVKS